MKSDSSIFNEFFNMIDKSTKQYEKRFCAHPSSYAPQYWTFDEKIPYNTIPRIMETESTDTELLIKIKLPGVVQSTIKVTADPQTKTITVTGTQRSAYSLSETKPEKEFKEIILISDKFRLKNPTLSTVADGILYLKFEIKDSAKKFDIKVD